MKNRFFWVGLVCLMLALTGWNCNISNCDDEKKDVRSQWGPPEEINTYDTSDYHSEDWWYWTKGFEYTFKWGRHVEHACETSRYNFTPIPADADKEFKSIIRDQMLLTMKSIS
jgi:hypothetical protein